MHCCPNCFWDTEIQAYITTNSPVIGNCDFCYTKNISLLKPIELADYLQSIIDIYEPIQDFDLLITPHLLLHECIIRDWKRVFRIADPTIIYNLIKKICQEAYFLNPLFFEEPVDFRGRDRISDPEQEQSWAAFVEEIKFQNRFFLNKTVNLDLLEKLLKTHRKEYKKGKLFYRARISSKDGFAAEHMGKPPIDKAIPGRANPKGISYLYLSNNETTTLYETRASLHDFITIGEFKLKEDILIVSLRNTDLVSPFQSDDEISNLLIFRNYISRLEQELSKPVRRNDSELDYLPTQYLCEFIKSLGFDGVEYKSSLYPEGFNLAIFGEKTLDCTKVKVSEITSLDYVIKDAGF